MPERDERETRDARRGQSAALPSTVPFEGADRSFGKIRRVFAFPTRKMGGSFAHCQVKPWT